jgi:glycosyltransferase involved in cell wall biosynthesis
MNGGRRVLVVCSTPLAAPWNGADKNIARALVRADTHNRYIVQSAPGEEWPEHVRAIETQARGAMPTRMQKLRAFAFLVQHAREADVVHLIASLGTPFPGSARAVRLWLHLLHKPIVHSMPSIGGVAMQPASFPGDLSVVFSESTRVHLEDCGMRRVVRIYPPLDFARLRAAHDACRMARDLALGEHAVLYPAHWGGGSGIEDILAAFARLPAALDDAVLVLACRPRVGCDVDHEREHVAALASNLGITRRLRVLGAVDDMPALIRACALTALAPTRMNAKMDLPMVVLESLALERPVVLADREPLREALLGHAGYLAPPGDIATLSAMLAHLLGDPAERARLGAAGRAAACWLCDPESAVARYRVFYDWAGGVLEQGL